MPEKIPMSAVMIARNAEQKIGAALASLAQFDEVIVYDNGSTDRTVEIALSFPNVVVHEGEFLGFGPTKNKAAGLASHDWIFSIDSDEIVTPQLRESIAAVDLDDRQTAYSVLRINIMRGKRIRYSGWQNDWILRLYNRQVSGLTQTPVHENVIPPPGGQVRKLDGELVHDAVRELGDFLTKIGRYGELRRTEGRPVKSPLTIFFRSLWAFIRCYFFQLGMLDGWRGLVIAVGEANGVFFKYMMPYADAVAERERSSSDGTKI